MESEVKGEVREVDLNKILFNPYQPRRHFDQEDLEELAQSIKSVGIIHPPLVRPLLEKEGYELISGERRCRAAKIAGMHSIPVLVCQASYSLSAQAALIENIQRVDLNPLEIAKAIQRLMLEFNLSQNEAAGQVGKKRSTVANYLRLLFLPPHIQNSISNGAISMGHAKVILGLESVEQQTLLHDLIRCDEMTVREAEKAAMRIQEKAKKQVLTYQARDFYLEQLAEKIQHCLGTKVTIQGKGKRGRIYIDYYSFDDLDRLLKLFGIKE